MKAYLEPTEVGLLEKATTNLRDGLLIRILFHTGVRVSEAVALAVEDLDLERETVRVIRQKERLRLYCPSCATRLGRCHQFCPGCGQGVAEVVRKAVEHRRVRTLPLDQKTAQTLREFIQRGGPVERKGRKLLFGINRGQAWRVVSQAAHRARLGNLVHPESGKTHGVSPHRLRDAFAVHAMKRDDSLDGTRLLQEMLGHASFNTTARYRKVATSELEDWYRHLWEGNETDHSVPQV